MGSLLRVRSRPKHLAVDSARQGRSSTTINNDRAWLHMSRLAPTFLRAEQLRRLHIWQRSPAPPAEVATTVGDDQATSQNERRHD